MEWENPFAANHGEDHTVLHLSKNEEKDDDLPYLKFRKFKQLAAHIINKHEEHAFPTAADDAESSTSYQPPPDAIMGPAGKGNTFYGRYGEYHNSQWTLPPAWTESGVMLVLPADPSFWQTSKQRNIVRLAVYQELDLDDNWDIVSADFDDSSVYSISEGEVMSRLNCPKCQLTTCALCARNYLGKTVNVKGKQPHKLEEEKDFHNNEVRLLKELLKEKTEQVQQMIKDQAKEYYENIKAYNRGRRTIEEHKIRKRKLKTQLQKEKKKETKARYSSEEFPPLGNPQIARPFIEAEVHYSENTTTAPKIRKITNQLYNVKVEFEIPNCPMFGTTAIIDTGTSACCINQKVIPEDALEPLTQTVFFNGLNSRQQATHRINQGSFLIEGNKFKIPLIYAFDMNDNNGIKMLIGANFLRSMKGGILIEGDEITIYKRLPESRLQIKLKSPKLLSLS
ncbi:RNA-directed DNA polymerase [Tanacetum coccineum]